MRLSTILAVSLTLGGAANAEEVAPANVSFDEGAVSVSLSGVPGDPANGAKVMNKGAGNCIACHEVTALNDLPFHGEVGPALDGAADRWTEAELRGIVANAKVMFPETMMPAFYKVSGFVRPGKAYTGKAIAPEAITTLLTAQEIEDVVSFLMTMKYC